MINLNACFHKVAISLLALSFVQSSCGKKESKDDGKNAPVASGRQISAGENFGGWKALSSGTNKTLRAITRLPKGDQFLAVGDGGTALFSKDGAKTWAVLNTKTTKNLTSIHWVNEVVVIGGEEIILLSQDGGETWNTTPLPGSTIASIGYFSSEEEKGFIAAGSGAELLRGVIPGGNLNSFDATQLKWNKTQVPEEFRLNAIVASFREVIVFGENGHVSLSRDAGKTFTKLSQISTKKSFLAATDGIAVGDGVISIEADTTGFPAGTQRWSTFESSEFPKMSALVCLSDCTFAGQGADGASSIGTFKRYFPGVSKPELKVEASNIPAAIFGISRVANFQSESVQLAVGENGTLLVKRIPIVR